MIKLSMKLPNKIAIAVSGGADSMAALDFLSRSNKEILALHYNHGTEHSSTAQNLVTQYCDRKQIKCVVDSLHDPVPKGDSKEDFWRRCRYEFFEKEAGDLPVITCHHLDDLVETWLFTSFHGEARLIPSQRGRYLRPFLITRKAVLEDWCIDKEVPYCYDPSNCDTTYMRNYIRHEVVPRALRVNPGLPKVLRKKILNNSIEQD